MSIPIAATPRLGKKATKRFLAMVEEGLRHPTRPIPTPKIDLAIKKVMEREELRRSI